MWQTKTFKTRKGMNEWLKQKNGLIQYEEVFINNGFAVEWRPLRFLLS